MSEIELQRATSQLQQKLCKNRKKTKVRFWGIQVLAQNVGNRTLQMCAKKVSFFISLPALFTFVSLLTLSITNVALCSESPDRDCCEPVYPFYFPTPTPVANNDVVGESSTFSWEYEDLPEEPMFNPTVKTVPNIITPSKSFSTITTDGPTQGMIKKEIIWLKNLM